MGSPNVHGKSILNKIGYFCILELNCIVANSSRFSPIQISLACLSSSVENFALQCLYLGEFTSFRVLFASTPLNAHQWKILNLLITPPPNLLESPTSGLGGDDSAM